MKSDKRKENWPLMVIGVTGTTGSGKSTFCSLIGETGVPVIDTDELARKSVEPGAPALLKLTELLGHSILNQDGAMNRGKVLEIILSDRKKRGEIENIIHPYVFKLMDNGLKRLFQKGHELVFVEVPLLFEAGWDRLFDYTIMVQAPEDVVLKRLVKKKKMDEGSAKKMLSIQMSQEEKAERADFVILNDSEIDTLKERAEKLVKKLYDIILYKKGAKVYK